ncbi:hypothetical protein ACI6PS_07295 [Flavobacterium sp. PLA-1-15]|uniref:hypothetical protein n=1 Tax=Flavobacterium sp. PLA-1-15 TaxID=3380533 RepID=UPI003B7A2445
MIRKILAVIGGLVAGGIVITLVEMVARQLHPFPEGIKMDDFAALAEHASKAPLSAQIAILVGYALGAITAGFVATIIAKDGKKIYATICASLFIISTIINLSMIETPIWFWIIALLLWIPLAHLGHRLASKKA